MTGRLPADVRRLLLPVLVALAAAAVVAVLGSSGSSAAVPSGAALSGAVAVAGGALVVRHGLREGPPGLFRVLLGLAALVWGAGQLLAAATWQESLPFPTVGDLISCAAAPLAVGGLALLSRRDGQPWRGTRLGAEALMVGAAAAALLWRLGFRQALLPHLSAADAVAVAFVVADLTVLALVLICVAQELDRGLVVLLVGMSLNAAADVLALHAAVRPGADWPWSATALACAGWPLICAGLLLIAGRPAHVPSSELPRAESRRLLTVTAVVLALLTGFLLTLLAEPALDPVTVALPGVVIVAHAVREVVNSRQSARLLRRFVEQAQRDALTGLANRWALTERLLSLQRRPRPVSVLTLDLDGFKDVNGLLGHSTGDDLLAAVARALQSRCPPGAEPFRLGGDEFAVLVECGVEEAVALGERLREAVPEASARVPGVARIPLAVSVGVASTGSPHRAPDPLRALADSALALRLAKQSGRNRVERYSTEVAAADRRRAAVERRLRRALATGSDVDVHLQPVVALRTGRVVGLEALARWTDAELGPVSPAEFVPVAESSGLIVELGRHVLERTVAIAAESGAAAAGVRVGVNVSPLQLRVPGFTDSVAGALHAAGVDPRGFVVEVTESSCVSERDPALATLQELSQLGVVIAIDDFGTGYSALGYLDRLPVDCLKLDCALTARFAEPRTLAVARGIVDLSRALGLDVIVEGIETPEQERLALELGASYGQGWLWSPAIPAGEVPALLAARAAPQAVPVGSAQR